MPYAPDQPLIVQGDHTVLLEVDNPRYPDARDALARFAELEKSPEHVHTYRITPLSLWNAAAAGATPDEILAALEGLSKYELPQNIVADIRDYCARFGRLKLRRDQSGRLVLESDDRALLVELSRNRRIQPYLLGPIGDELRRRVHTTSLEEVEIVTAALGTWAGAIGAAIHGAEEAERKEEAAAVASVGAT